MDDEKWNVNVEDIEDAVALLRRFQQLKLENVVLFRNGVKIEYPAECVEDFKYTGLANRDFVMFKYWDNWQPSFNPGASHAAK